MQPILETISRTGSILLTVVGALFLTTLAALIFYTIRHGKSDADQDPSADSKESITAGQMGTIGTNRLIAKANYRTKKKILASRSGFITDDSLAEGTATPGERWMVRGIKLFITLFWLLFVSIGLMTMKSNLLAVFFIIIPSFWFFGNVRSWQRGAEAAKKRVAKRAAAQHGEAHTPVDQSADS
jgi:hypothetical protein